MNIVATTLSLCAEMRFHFEFLPGEADSEFQSVPIMADFTSISMAVWQAEFAMKSIVFTFGKAERCIITSEDRTFMRVTTKAGPRAHSPAFSTRGVAIRPFVML
jgi:hypothetical protein